MRLLLVLSATTTGIVSISIGACFCGLACSLLCNRRSLLLLSFSRPAYLPCIQFMTSTLASTDSLLDEPWLATDAGKAKFIYPGAPIQEMYQSCWPGIQDAWLESPLKTQAINSELYPDSIEICKIFAGEGNNKHQMWNAIYAHLQSRPVKRLPKLATSPCGSLLPAASADVRSSDDVIAF